jgi:hypothetical protein
MLIRLRFHLPALLMVLLALSVQLGLGSRVPSLDPLAFAAGAICHAPERSDRSRDDHAPLHSSDCLLCPLCVALHAPSVFVVPATALIIPPTAQIVLRPELPPPATAPPSLRHRASQPRAPPAS